MGVYLRQPHPKCLSIMARVRIADAASALGVDGDWTRGGRAHGDLLYAARLDVRIELCAGRLGHP